MKFQELLLEMYTAYVLDKKSRRKLLKTFPPKYPKVIGHHITVKFGVSKQTSIPSAADIKVVGYADSADGLEALVVSVNGKTTRPDGSTYHITWSLDPTKYKPVDSNKLLKKSSYKTIEPIKINTTPDLLK